MKRVLGITGLLLVALMLAPVMWVLAGYTYAIPITIENTSSGGVTLLPVLVTINSSLLAETGYINSSGLNTNVQEGSTNRDYMVGESRLGIFVPTISGYQLRTYDYQLGYSPDQPDFSVMVGLGGNLTVEDDGTLEIGANFTFVASGYVNVAASRPNWIAYKPEAFGVHINSTDVTSYLLGAINWTSPTGHADPGSGWGNETLTYDDNLTTNATSSSLVAGNWTTALELTHVAVEGEGLRFMADTVGGNFTLVNVDAYYDSAWHDVYAGTFNDDNGGTVWNTVYLNDFVPGITSLRFYFYAGSGDGSAVLYEADYGPVNVGATVTASDVLAGAHTVGVSADGTNMKIYVDGVEEDTATLDGASAFDSDSGWLFMYGEAMPYVDYFKVMTG